MIMKKIIWAVPVIFCCTVTSAQELYVNTEPASNMAAGSMGLRFLSRYYKMNYNDAFSSYRLEPEVMLGLGKRWMVHLAGYGSNMYQKAFRIEGGSLYAKYRIYSEDAVHEHFRIAAFSKVSIISNPSQLLVTRKKIVPDGNGGFTEQVYTSYDKNEEFDLDGNNSGILAGAVATKLVHKLAASGSVSYGYRFNSRGDTFGGGEFLHAVNYSASLGYLFLPHTYTSYNQTNVNLYIEFLGTSFPGTRKSYLDVAPAIQFIFKSIARVDLSYRSQLAGNAQRLSSDYLLLRLEYNLLNVF